MNERPPQPPEGRLIAAAARARGLSVREASRRAGISYGRWRQITSGVQNVSPGSYAAVRAPAATLARMAQAAGVTPESLAAEGNRPDAAGILREILSAPAAPGQVPGPASPPARDTGEIPVITADPGELSPYIDAVWEEIGYAKAAHGPHPSGAQAFPADVHEARMWDRPELSEAERVRLVSFIRMMTARYRRGTNGHGQQAS